MSHRCYGMHIAVSQTMHVGCRDATLRVASRPWWPPCAPSTTPRPWIFAPAKLALGSVEALRARRDALAAKHAGLLRELANLRASATSTLSQAEEAVRADYAATNRGAL